MFWWASWPLVLALAPLVLALAPLVLALAPGFSL